VGIGIFDHICSCDLDLDQITIYKLDQYTLKVIIIINKVLIKVMLNKVIAGALYIVICG